MENQNVRIAVSFVIGILVGVGGYWLVAHRTPMMAGDDSLVSTSGQMGTSTSAAMIIGDNGVIVADQTPGYTVTVAQVVLQSAGWVAIADDVNGLPGKILGAKYFDAGKGSGIVPLLRATVAGHSY